MKKLKLLALMSCLSIILISCDDENIPECVKGTIIGYEMCSNAVIIQVVNVPNIGDEIIYYNDSTYSNVVRAPGVRGEYGYDDIYFNYRIYDKENDYPLFKPVSHACLRNIIPFDVPIIVITEYSTSNCTNSDEN